MIFFRKMGLDELQQVLDWAAAEGWNPGLDDAVSFHAADPEGFFVARDGEDIVAAISVVNHSEAYAFLGLYLCLPEYRGKGIGYALWQHALAHAGTRCVGLDGVQAQQANYERSGFVRSGETVRYAGRIAADTHPEVRLMQPTEAGDVVALEARASGQAKPYLERWVRGDTTRQTFVLDREGEIAGFATVRACRAGAKIGPLWAQTAEDARALLQVAAIPFGESVMIDVPTRSDLLGDICDDMGLTPGFRTARMYRGIAPDSTERLFAVATLELG